MYYQRMKSKASNQGSISHITISKRHEDLVFMAVRQLEVVFRNLLHAPSEDNIASHLEHYDVDVYRRLDRRLKQNSQAILTAFCQQLKRCWLSPKGFDGIGRVESDIDLRNMPCFSDQMALASLIQKSREKNFGILKSMRSKLTELLDVNPSLDATLPFDVEHIYRAFSESLKEGRIDLDDILSVMKVFEHELSSRLSDVYYRIVQHINKKLDINTQHFFDSFSDNEDDGRDFYDDVLYGSSKKSSTYCDEASYFKDALQQILSDYISGKQHEDAKPSQLKKVFLRALEDKLGTTVVLEPNYENVLAYVSSTFSILSLKVRSKEIQRILFKLQFVFLRIAFDDEDFVASHRHPAKKLLNLIIKVSESITEKKIPEAQIVRLLNISLNDILKSGVLDEKRVREIIGRLSQNYSKILSYSRLTQGSLNKEFSHVESTQVKSFSLKQEVASKLKQALDKKKPSKLLLYLAQKIWYRTLLMIASLEGMNSALWREQYRLLQVLISSLTDGNYRREQFEADFKSLASAIIRNIDDSDLNFGERNKLIAKIAEVYSHRFKVEIDENLKLIATSKTQRIKTEAHDGKVAIKQVSLQRIPINSLHEMETGSWYEYQKGSKLINIRFRHRSTNDRFIFDDRLGKQVLNLSQGEMITLVNGYKLKKLV